MKLFLLLFIMCICVINYNKLLLTYRTIKNYIQFMLPKDLSVKSTLLKVKYYSPSR